MVLFRIYCDLLKLTYMGGEEMASNDFWSEKKKPIANNESKIAKEIRGILIKPLQSDEKIEEICAYISQESRAIKEIQNNDRLKEELVPLISELGRDYVTIDNSESFANLLKVCPFPLRLSINE